MESAAFFVYVYEGIIKIDRQKRKNVRKDLC